MSHQPNPFLQERYDQLWTQSSKRIRAGAIEIDPVLAQGHADCRRGLTLLFRPSPQVQEKIAECLEELRTLEPDQHYYHPSELHVTFLSVSSASEEPKALFDHTEELIDAIGSCIRELDPFTFTFSGITASHAAIMFQGFTDATRLNAVRDELRACGLNQGANERYRLKVAHMTALRFRRPLRDSTAFASTLEKLRDLDFGAFEATSLELVKSDWYMSRDVTQSLYIFPLGHR